MRIIPSYAAFPPLFAARCQSTLLPGAIASDFFSSRKHCPKVLYDVSGEQFKAFASSKSEKKLMNVGKSFKLGTRKHTNNPPKGFEDSQDNSRDGDGGSCNTFDEPRDNLSIYSSPVNPARDAVLKACTITSGALLALGFLIREASHIASMAGWPILDASAELSSCRYMLLKTWPEFSESSEVANQQVLGSLQPLDYLVVAFLPGISEELLFRGALLPLLGLSWKSALIVGAIFGVLHLGGGRRYPFAIWASFVGFIYGIATVESSSIIVPMASHALNNLIGGILWQYKSSSEMIDK